MIFPCRGAVYLDHVWPRNGHIIGFIGGCSICYFQRDIFFKPSLRGNRGCRLSCASEWRLVNAMFSIKVIPLCLIVSYWWTWKGEAVSISCPGSSLAFNPEMSDSPIAFGANAPSPAFNLTSSGCPNWSNNTGDTGSKAAMASSAYLLQLTSPLLYSK